MYSVLLDIDGVLNHGERFSDRYKKEIKVAPEVIDNFFKNRFGLCLIGKADLREELEDVLKDWNWKGTVSDLLNFWFEGEVNPTKELFEIVEQLKSENVPLFAGTNQEKYRSEHLKRVLKLKDKFKKVYTSADVGVKKPELGFFNAILKENNIKPEELVYWDDDEENVASAKGLGINAFVYRSFDNFMEEMKKFFPFLVDTTKTTNFYKDFVFSGKVKVNKVKETDNLLAFFHTKPSWNFHIVIVPKSDIESLTKLENKEILVEIFDTIKEIIKKYDLESTNFKVINNGGSFQDSKHLHFHLVSEKQI